MPLTSTAQQTEQDLGRPGSVPLRRRSDHQELEGLLIRLRSSADAEQDEVMADIARLVFPHSLPDEAGLWPAVSAALRNGQAVICGSSRSTRKINELWPPWNGPSG